MARRGSIGPPRRVRRHTASRPGCRAGARAVSRPGAGGLPARRFLVANPRAGQGRVADRSAGGSRCGGGDSQQSALSLSGPSAFSPAMDSKKLALLCRELADNKKAENIVILDVRELSSVADYFVICSGTSEPHLRAISDEIVTKLRDEQHLRPKAIDGTLQTAWVVLDYFDVIVHVMKNEVREKYDLEALWGDAPRVRPRKSRAKVATA